MNTRYTFCPMNDIHGHPLGITEDGLYTDIPEVCPECHAFLNTTLTIVHPPEKKCRYCGYSMKIEYSENPLDSKSPVTNHDYINTKKEGTT